MLKLLIVAAFFLASANPLQAEIVPLSMWYEAPASDWESEALPIGNGAMGAMIFGGVDVERVQFNEKTLWTGGPGAKSGYDFGIPQRSLAGAVDRVALEIERSTQLAPETVVRNIGRKARGYGDYQSFGELQLTFSPAQAKHTNYRRELDLDNAIARVSYLQGGVRYERKYFASYPDGLIVIRLSADRPGRITFRAKIAIPDNRSRSIATREGRIVVEGALHDNDLHYATAAQVLIDGGTRSELAGGQIGVVGANSATILLTAGTNYLQDYPHYRGEDPQERIKARLDAAASVAFETLLRRHIADYRELFGRVALDIGHATTAIPTDRLLKQYGTDDSQDRALEALYFQYGRYLLIASSRAGSLPANLQGVWNHSATPPWNADYHVNINLQMNYWPAETTNLAETAAPLFDFIDSLVEPGRESARRIAGSPGWTLFLNTNVWGYTGLIDWPTAFWQPESAAWLAQHYYEHYRFSRDESFLRRRAWPVMKEAAEFWIDALRTDPRDGSLVVSPSYSPEHGPFTAGASMSQQVVFDLLTNVVEAGAVVGDAAFTSKAAAVLKGMDPGTRIGSWDQLQEWKADLDDRDNEHRHVSHLFALHPGKQISPQTTPQLAQAARVSLEARGDGGTGWSKAWKINFWARLWEGDRAHKLLGEQLRESTLTNLFDTHPPFQIDGNFGATAGIAEMLLQSHDNVVHILPALPSAWRTGSVQGLRARGNVTVDISWRDAKVDRVVLRCGQDGALQLRSGLLLQPHALTDLDTGDPIRTEGTGELRTFQAVAGKTYELAAREQAT